jgi:sterol desaturase/sphingolipid hydroxylase (fatty acid hydroxylase superfamily)
MTVLVLLMSISALNAQLEHARVTWPPGLERWVRLLFVTPAMHRVHHSRLPHDTDTNYSNIFSLWDRLFGTFRTPRPGEPIDCGLDEFDGRERQRTAALLALPLV